MQAPSYRLDRLACLNMNHAVQVLAMIAITALLSSLTACGPAKQQDTPPGDSQQAQAKPYLEKIDSLVQSLVDNSQTVSASLGIQVGGHAPVIKHYGTTVLGKTQRPDGQSQYRIASITKPFTAVAITQLAEAGKISLSDTLGRFFPGFPNGGEIITLASGQSYEDYLAAHIYQPSGITGMTMERDGQDTAHWVPGYGYDGSLDTPFVAPARYPMPYSAGGLRATTKDLLKFFQALNQDKLVSADMRDLMTQYAQLADGHDVDEDRFYFPPDFQRPTPPPYMQKYGYGLGFSRMKVYGAEAIWHGGSIAGFQAVMAYLPKSNLTMALLTNTGGPGGYGAVWAEIQQYLSQIPPPKP